MWTPRPPCYNRGGLRLITVCGYWRSTLDLMRGAMRQGEDPTAKRDLLLAVPRRGACGVGGCVSCAFFGLLLFGLFLGLWASGD